MTDSTDDRDNGGVAPTGRWSVATQRHYDPDAGEELTTALVYAIAEAKGVDSKAVTDPPLHECVDVASLETALFRPSHDGETTGTSIEFFYEEYRVEVGDDGWITVSEPDGGD